MTRIATETIQPIWEKYFHQVDEGETIVFTTNDVPVAEIHPVNGASEKKLRPYGLAEGEFELPADFNDPLPDDILRLFTLE